MSRSALRALAIATGVLLCTHSLYAFTEVTESLAPCVVYLMQDVKVGEQASIGSGFLLSADNTTFLVTASHVAQALGQDLWLVMPDANGRAIKARMSNIKWVESSVADVAVTPVRPIDPGQRKDLLCRSLPAHLLSARPLPPSRDIPLTVMGYPLGLGATGYVSPLSLETKAASGFITLPRFDNNKLSTFILLQNPAIGGLSGGPVFDTGKMYFTGERMTVVRSGVSVVGLIHGVISDKTGGKFAAVVPATEILKLVPGTEAKK